MKDKITKDIVSILNNNSSLENKRNNIYSLRKYKHKENRTLLNIVATILTEFILPIIPEEDIDFDIHEHLSKNNINQLKAIIDKSKCRYFNSICNELLWIETHDIKYAKNALIDYQSELKMPTEEHEFSYTKVALSICRIYAKTKVEQFNFYEFINNALSYIKSNYEKQGYCILHILKGLTKCNEYHSEIESSYKDAIQYYEFNKKFDKAIAFLEALEDFYSLTQNDTEKNNTRIKIAINYEKQADQLDWSDKEHTHKIIDLIQKSMSSWNKTKTQTKRKKEKG